MGTGVQFTLKVIDQASSVLDKIGLSLNNLKGVAMNLGGHLARGLAMGGAAAAGMLGLLSRNAVNLASDFQQAKIAFTGMLGSAPAASQLLDTLQKFANVTPFEFPQLVNATRLMMAFGFTTKELIPTLTAVGDAVSGLGGGSEKLEQAMEAIGKIKSQGFLSGREAMELSRIGINAYQMVGEAFNITIPEAMKRSETRMITADEALKAILGGMERRFPGMMAMQSRTLQGVISTLHDTWNMGLRKMGEAALPGLTQLTVTLTNLVTNLFSDDNIKKAQKFFAGMFSDKNAFKAAGFIGDLVAGFEYAGDIAKQLWTDMKTGIADFASFSVGVLVDFSNGITKIINLVNGSGGLEVVLMKAAYSFNMIMKPVAYFLAASKAFEILTNGGSFGDAGKAAKGFMDDWETGMSTYYDEIQAKTNKMDPLPIVDDSTKAYMQYLAKQSILDPGGALDNLTKPMSDRASSIQNTLFKAWKDAGAFLAKEMKPGITAAQQTAAHTGIMAGLLSATLFGNGGDRMSMYANRARFGNLNTSGGGVNVTIKVADQDSANQLKYLLQRMAAG